MEPRRLSFQYVERQEDRSHREAEEAKLSRTVVGVAVTNDNHVNLRLGVSRDKPGPVFIQVGSGLRLALLEAQAVPGWHRVCYQNRILYVSADLANVHNETASCD